MWVNDTTPNIFKVNVFFFCYELLGGENKQRKKTLKTKPLKINTDHHDTRILGGYFFLFYRKAQAA